MTLAIGTRVQDNHYHHYGTVVDYVVPPVPTEPYYWIEWDNSTWTFAPTTTRLEDEVSVIPQVGDRVFIEPCNDDEWEQVHKFQRRAGVVFINNDLGSYPVGVRIENVARRHTKKQEVFFRPNELTVL